MENRAVTTTAAAKWKFHTCNAIGITENDLYLLSTNFWSVSPMPYVQYIYNHAKRNIFFVEIRLLTYTSHLLLVCECVFCFILFWNLPSRVSPMMWTSISFFYLPPSPCCFLLLLVVVVFVCRFDFFFLFTRVLTLCDWIVNRHCCVYTTKIFRVN